MRRANKDVDTEDDFLDFDKKKKKVVVRETTKTEHIYRIDYELEEFEDSEELVELLLTAPEDDTVNIFINSGGGRLDIADWIVQNIKSARARGVVVIGELGFTVASGATYIALSCSGLIISPHTQFLIHNWETERNPASATATFRDAEFNKRQSDKWIKEVYGVFLSEKEIQDLIDNPKDLQFTAEEVKERWDRVVKEEEAEVVVKQPKKTTKKG